MWFRRGIEEVTWEREDEMRQCLASLCSPVVACGSLCSFLLPRFWLAALVVVVALCCGWLLLLKVNFGD